MEGYQQLSRSCSLGCPAWRGPSARGAPSPPPASTPEHPLWTALHPSPRPRSVCVCVCVCVGMCVCGCVGVQDVCVYMQMSVCVWGVCVCEGDHWWALIRDSLNTIPHKNMGMETAWLSYLFLMKYKRKQHTTIHYNTPLVSSSQVLLYTCISTHRDAQL